jgi:hypothetical protein
VADFGSVWRRSFLKKIGCFDETLLSMQDLEMHVRAIGSAVSMSLPDIDHDIEGTMMQRRRARHWGSGLH